MSQDTPNLPKFELSPRKCCVTCNKPFIAFMGQFLHVEEPCAGIKDCIDIEAVISDDFLHKKFEEMYGKPEMDDYARILALEEEIRILEDFTGKAGEKIKETEEKLADSLRLLNKPLIRFFLKCFH